MWVLFHYILTTVLNLEFIFPWTSYEDNFQSIIDCCINFYVIIFQRSPANSVLLRWEKHFGTTCIFDGDCIWGDQRGTVLTLLRRSVFWRIFSKLIWQFELNPHLYMTQELFSPLCSPDTWSYGAFCIWNR